MRDFTVQRFLAYDCSNGSVGRETGRRLEVLLYSDFWPVICSNGSVRRETGRRLKVLLYSDFWPMIVAMGV